MQLELSGYMSCVCPGVPATTSELRRDALRVKSRNIGSVLSGERSWYIHEFENSLLCLEYIMWGCEFPESSKNN